MQWPARFNATRIPHTYLFWFGYLYFAMKLIWNSLNFSRNTFSSLTVGRIVILCTKTQGKHIMVCPIT